MNVEYVPGYCNFDELYRQAVQNASDGAVFVELGSLWGRSTFRMASSIKESQKNIKFYCIDVWDLRGISAGEWSKEDIVWGNKMGTNTQDNIDFAYETFLAALFKLNLQNYTFPIKLSSRVAHRLFEDNSISFLFIDADHSYEGVLEDIELWLPKVAEGGVIAGHDYDWTGVKKAVDEKFAGKEIKIYNTSWIVQK